MSDYRNMDFDFRDPDDPFPVNAKRDPNRRGPRAAWAWIAAALVLVIVLAVAFGVGHQPGHGGTNMASNTMAPPAAGRTAPTVMPPPRATPAPTSNVAPPIAAMPARPAQESGTR